MPAARTPVKRRRLFIIVKETQDGEEPVPDPNGVTLISSLLRPEVWSLAAVLAYWRLHAANPDDAYLSVHKLNNYLKRLGVKSDATDEEILGHIAILREYPTLVQFSQVGHGSTDVPIIEESADGRKFRLAADPNYIRLDVSDELQNKLASGPTSNDDQPSADADNDSRKFAPPTTDSIGDHKPRSVQNDGESAPTDGESDGVVELVVERRTGQEERTALRFVDADGSDECLGLSKAQATIMLSLFEAAIEGRGSRFPFVSSKDLADTLERKKILVAVTPEMVHRRIHDLREKLRNMELEWPEGHSNHMADKWAKCLIRNSLGSGYRIAAPARLLVLVILEDK